MKKQETLATKYAELLFADSASKCSVRLAGVYSATISIGQSLVDEADRALRKLFEELSQNSALIQKELTEILSLEKDGRVHLEVMKIVLGLWLEIKMERHLRKLAILS